MVRSRTTRVSPPIRRAIVGTPAAEIRSALDAFRRIVQALRLAGRDGERRLGLSSAQAFALQQIAEHPSVSINDVAALTFTHQSTVSVVVQRLVAKGLVAKTAARDDRRRHRLVVTPRGRRLLQRAPAPVQGRVIAAMAALSDRDRRALARALSRVAAFTARDASGPPPMLFEEAASGARSPRRG